MSGLGGVVPEALRPPSVFAGQWMALSARRSPSQEAFVDNSSGRTYTFSETNSRIDQLCQALVALGLRQGSVVGVLATDCVQYVEVMYAALRLGIILVPLNYRLTIEELESQIGRVRPAILFVSGRYADHGSALCRSVESISRVIALDDPDSHAVSEEYEELLGSGSSNLADPGIGREDIALVAFTSGTTGTPKGVLQSHGMLVNRILSSLLEYGIREREHRYCASPLFHVGGQTHTHMNVLRGATTYLNPQFDPNVTLDWMSSRLTSCFLVPTMIAQILNLPETKSRTFSSLNTIAYGAAPIHPSLLKRAMDIFECEFIQAYSAGTEGGGSTFLSREDHRRALAGEVQLLSSIGRPATAVDVRICTPDGKEAEVGDVGEIVTRSNYLMSGYLASEARTAEAFQGGWYHTGDLARTDAEGYLYLEGRIDDMIVRGGENIYPAEIERILLEVPGVGEACVVGIPDQHWGQIIAAAIVAHSGIEISPEDLGLYCRRRIAAYKAPEHWLVLSEMPKTASGKVSRAILRSYF